MDESRVIELVDELAKAERRLQRAVARLDELGRAHVEDLEPDLDEQIGWTKIHAERVRGAMAELQSLVASVPASV